LLRVLSLGAVLALAVAMPAAAQQPRPAAQPPIPLAPIPQAPAQQAPAQQAPVRGVPAQQAVPQQAPAMQPPGPPTDAPTQAQQAAPQQAAPQQVVPASDMQITWQVRNRFRLFREERDFDLQVEAMRRGSILAAEDALEVQSDGRGWARNAVNRLCIDRSGHISEPCTRDNVKESYLAPADHPVTVRLAGQIPVGATCAWTFDDGQGPRQLTLDCAEPINLRAPSGHPMTVTADISSGTGPTQRATTDIEVRDILIAGLGDSIASGEGNPDRQIALANEGFCFQSYLGGPGSEYFRPSRAGYKGGRACGSGGALQAWQRESAVWFNPACHRSLYSYQTRIAIALAVQYPHIAVTYLPLACTGATIDEGLFGSQRARECIVTKSGVDCQGKVSGQIAELRRTLAAAQKRQPDRRLDLILLSIGANDIDFSGLVANVIVDSPTERELFKRTGVLGSVDDAREALTNQLPRGFARLRAALKPLVSDLSHVVFVSYANPALANGAPCPGGRAGFDIHPSFKVDAQRLNAVEGFVQNEFLPGLKAIVLCQSGVICRDPGNDRMTFVDAHQPAFANHGFCARAHTDPEFDQACFSAKGDSFVSDMVTAASQPLACGRGASEFRAYLPRARWIRDANDSYFAAMTYPQGLPASSQPSDIHDATWGVLSAVYGGAVHPTAEGHAAMADAALPAVASVLHLNALVPQVIEEPISPPDLPPEGQR
jgi:lysophospholipase L1-like esterase